MCGIAAIIGKNANECALFQLLSTIRHRGEDRFFGEYAVFPFAALGANRLAIVERESGVQPLTSFDNRYICVCNGEIYNHHELKASLRSLGAEFRTNSDVEVIIQAYATWGRGALTRLRGMFAFVIFDTQTGDFFAARDHIGIKPLYWALDGGGTYYLASEIKALTILSQISEIHVFPPGASMMNGRLQQCWRIPMRDYNSLSEEECIAQLRTLFDDAVRSHVDTDLPIAVYLSGGIDSAAILATARRFHGNVTAVIMGRPNSEDRRVATRYCSENQIPFEIISPPNEDEIVQNDLPSCIRVVESFEPNVVRASTFSRYLARCAAERQFKVILCGEGSDEVFGGYSEFLSATNETEFEERIESFLGDLHRTQLQRVDRTSMEVTTEVRVPFLDRSFMEFALSIPVALRTGSVADKTRLTKHIFRKAMEDRLPAYVCNRPKVIMNVGAGYSDNKPEGNPFVDWARAQVDQKEFEMFVNDFSEWNLATREEVYYFKIFDQLSYTKARFNQQRVTANRSR